MDRTLEILEFIGKVADYSSDIIYKMIDYDEKIKHGQMNVNGAKEQLGNDIIYVLGDFIFKNINSGCRDEEIFEKIYKQFGLTVNEIKEYINILRSSAEKEEKEPQQKTQQKTQPKPQEKQQPKPKQKPQEKKVEEEEEEFDIPIGIIIGYRDGSCKVFEGSMDEFESEFSYLDIRHDGPIQPFPEDVLFGIGVKFHDRDDEDKKHKTDEEKYEYLNKLSIDDLLDRIEQDFNHMGLDIEEPTQEEIEKMCQSESVMKKYSIRNYNQRMGMVDEIEESITLDIEPIEEERNTIRLLDYYKNYPNVDKDAVIVDIYGNEISESELEIIERHYPFEELDINRLKLADKVEMFDYNLVSQLKGLYTKDMNGNIQHLSTAYVNLESKVVDYIISFYSKDDKLIEKYIFPKEVKDHMLEYETLNILTVEDICHMIRDSLIEYIEDIDRVYVEFRDKDGKILNSNISFEGLDYQLEESISPIEIEYCRYYKEYNRNYFSIYFKEVYCNLSDFYEVEYRETDF